MFHFFLSNHKIAGNVLKFTLSFRLTKPHLSNHSTDTKSFFTNAKRDIFFRECQMRYFICTVETLSCNLTKIFSFFKLLKPVPMLVLPLNLFVYILHFMISKTFHMTLVGLPCWNLSFSRADNFFPFKNSGIEHWNCLFRTIWTCLTDFSE